MLQAHHQVVALSNIVKTIWDEFQIFNPLNSLKNTFWYLIGIILLMICCFCLLSFGAQRIRKFLFR
jgi:hypothetical protein